MTPMTLKRKLVELTSLGVIDILLVKLSLAIAFLLAARFLPRTDLGIVGLAAGYVVILKLLAVQPEGILLRHFPRMQDSLNEHLSGFIVFWFLRLSVLQAIGGVLSLGLFLLYGESTLPLYLFGAVFILNLELFIELTRETFRIGFKQRTVLLVNALFSALQIAFVSLLVVFPSLFLYLGVLLFINGTNAIAWYLLLRSRYHFRFSYDRTRTFSLLKENIQGFSLWAHLNSSVIFLLYQIDTVILGFFVSLEVIGDYTIALMVANFFFIVPAIFHKSFAIGFSRIEDRQVRNALSTFLRYSLLVGIGQFLFYLAFGELIVSIFSATHIGLIVSYSLFIIAGVTLFNIFRPFFSLAIAKGDMRALFFRVSLPAGVISVGAYAAMTAWWGPLGTAAGNIVSYGVFVGLLLRYAAMHLNFDSASAT